MSPYSRRDFMKTMGIGAAAMMVPRLGHGAEAAPGNAQRNTMAPLDYGQSFLIGNAALNEVRFWVESRTRIIDDQTGKVEDYIQTGACKSENTFGEKDLFYEDNYDFLPIFGPEYGVIFRRKAYVSGRYKSCPAADAMWEGQKYHLVESKDAKELTDNAAILAATYAYTPLVSQTEIRNEETGLRAIIECPVKTINTHREKNIYQVDTGPVAFPDLSTRHERHVDGIALAFIAFNVPHFADFILEVPTQIGEGDKATEVYHYSKRLSRPAQNRLYGVKPVV